MTSRQFLCNPAVAAYARPTHYEQRARLAQRYTYEPDGMKRCDEVIPL